MERYDRLVHNVLYSGRTEPEWFCCDQIGIRAQKERGRVSVALVSTRSEVARELFLLHKDPITSVDSPTFSEGFADLLSRLTHQNLPRLQTTQMDDWIRSSYELQLLVYGSPKNTPDHNRRIHMGIFFDKHHYVEVEKLTFSQAVDCLTTQVNPDKLERKIKQIEAEKEKILAFIKPGFEYQG